MDEHLREIDQQAEAMFSQLVVQIAIERDITETLKASDQMAWVGKMSNIHATASEIVEKELIYVRRDSMKFYVHTWLSIQRTWA